MQIEFLKDNLQFIDELNELCYRQWGAIYPELSKEDWKHRLIARANKKKIPTTMVAIENSRVLGSAALLEHDMRTRPDLSPWLGGVYVKEEHRRQGIGRALVGYVERLAGELGLLTLYLYTPDKQQFYSQLGWTVFEKTNYQGFDVTIMLKHISVRQRAGSI